MADDMNSRLEQLEKDHRAIEYWWRGNGQIGAAERLRRLEESTERQEKLNLSQSGTLRDMQDTLLQLNAGWHVVKFVGLVMLPAVVTFGVWVARILTQIAGGS